MKTNVSKTWLIEKLTANRAKHRDVFVEAMEGYRKYAIGVFEKQIQAAKDGKKFDHYINMTQPVDMTKEYDTVLGLLAQSTEDTIELDSDSYSMYVLDQWHWRASVATSNNMYTMINKY